MGRENETDNNHYFYDVVMKCHRVIVGGLDQQTSISEIFVKRKDSNLRL